jgi:ribonucleotide reductase alpha subunit
MIPGKVIFGDILLAYKLGLKSLYYNNNLKKAEIEKDESDDTDCESCKI